MNNEQQVRPAKHLDGTVFLPPDKSISHRAAMFAALYEGTSKIGNFSEAADPQSTLVCLQQLGVQITGDKGSLTIEGVGRTGFKDPETPLDCGNSGTTMRLLSGIVGGAGLRCSLTGDASLSGRTMKRIIDPLRKMNIDISGRDGDYAPLLITSKRPVQGIRFSLPIPSAQLKSCVLLAGLFGEETTEVIESTASRDHTERLLGLPVKDEGGVRIISSNRSLALPEQSYRIPGDFSAAAFWLVAGSIHPDASIRLPGVGINPTRTAAMDILKNMGASIKLVNKRKEGPEPVADLEIAGGSLQPVFVTEDLVPNCIDEIPILAIAMLFAEGVSRVEGAEELRHKETDRLAALADILDRAGARFEVFNDGLEIHGDPDFEPEPSFYKSFHDHRIAMSAAVLSTKGTQPSAVSDASCTDISYPGFWKDLSKLTN